MYVPVGQREHALVPVASAYFPSVQTPHVVFPVDEVNFPFAQLMQAEREVPKVLKDVPTGHLVQDEAPAVE